MENEIATKGCQKENNTDLEYDPRYKLAGLTTNLYNLRRDNGLQEHLTLWSENGIKGPTDQ